MKAKKSSRAETFRSKDKPSFYKLAIYLTAPGEEIDVTQLKFESTNFHYLSRDQFLITKDKVKLFEQQLKRPTFEETQQAFFDIEFAKLRIVSRSKD